MRKIPTIFIRNPDNMRELLPEMREDCEWVARNEGKPTRKYDGTCCKIMEGKLYKRREVKAGRSKPIGFIEEAFDNKTEKCFGWLPVEVEGNQDRWHREAFDNQPDGTYELCGPKINGNPENYKKHTLIPHATAEIYDHCPVDFEGLKQWLALCPYEGVVWHHPDGRMAKIKKRDFGYKRLCKK